VWQLYSHDLEPNAALFAVRKACEPAHIQMNEDNWHVMVINNLPAALESARAVVSVYNLDGALQSTREVACNAAPCLATDLGAVDWPPALSQVHFIRLRLLNARGALLSDNFYWRALPRDQDNFQDLNRLPQVILDAAVARHDADGKCLLDVSLGNRSGAVALTAHLQLRRKGTGERVLPVYYTDNYVSLLPGESKVISIEASQADLAGGVPRVVVDGWNTTVETRFFPENGGAEIAANTDAIVDPAAPRTFTVMPAPAGRR
jgi:beta-mannosidase